MAVKIKERQETKQKEKIEWIIGDNCELVGVCMLWNEKWIQAIKCVTEKKIDENVEIREDF